MDQPRRRLPGRLVRAASGSLIATVALSAVVGWVGGERGYDWALAATFGTALGTTLLALTTGALAYLTWQEVGATQRLAALTAEDQAARERPVVIQHSATYRTNKHQGGPVLEEWISVELINAGLGPAIRVRVDATYIDSTWKGKVTPEIWPVIRPGETALFALTVNTEQSPSGGIDERGFRLYGSYVDRSQKSEYRVITDWQAGPEKPAAPPSQT
jgi:hypothetical protein